MSWQQAIARATSVAPTPPEQSQALLWATGCVGSLARLCPLPVQARGRGKEKADFSGIPAGASGGGGVPLRMEVGLGTHSQPASSQKLQPPACLAAAHQLLCDQSPRVPMGVGVLCHWGDSMVARGGREGLGCLAASAERTVGPRRHVSGAANSGASSSRRASGLEPHQLRSW